MYIITIIKTEVRNLHFAILLELLLIEIDRNAFQNPHIAHEMLFMNTCCKRQELSFNLKFDFPF